MKTARGLDVSRLENVRHSGAKTTAKCPACAEAGGDTKGEHLFIDAGGRFGCVMYPGTEGATHRQRIFALVGIVEKSTPTRKPPRTYRTPEAVARVDEEGPDVVGMGVEREDVGAVDLWV